MQLSVKLKLNFINEALTHFQRNIYFSKNGQTYKLGNINSIQIKKITLTSPIVQCIVNCHLRVNSWIFPVKVRTHRCTNSTYTRIKMFVPNLPLMYTARCTARIVKKFSEMKNIFIVCAMRREFWSCVCAVWEKVNMRLKTEQLTLIWQITMCCTLRS